MDGQTGNGFERRCRPSRKSRLAYRANRVLQEKDRKTDRNVANDSENDRNLEKRKRPARPTLRNRTAPGMAEIAGAGRIPQIHTARDHQAPLNDKASVTHCSYPGSVAVTVPIRPPKVTEIRSCTASWFRYNTFLRVGAIPRQPRFLGSSTAEHPAVNRRVVGSNPTRGASIHTAVIRPLFLFFKQNPGDPRNPHEGRNPLSALTAAAPNTLFVL